MKKLRFVLMLLFIGTGTIMAQERNQDHIDQQDHLVLKNGIMMQIKDNDQIRLQDKITLRDGTVVNPDGTYLLKKGRRLRLQDGECLDMEGEKYNNQEMLRLELAKRRGDHFMFKNGAMWQVKGDNQEKLQQRFTLSNKAMINPDGTYQLKGRKQLRLQDGECLDMEGKRYRSHEMFRQDFDRRTERMMRVGDRDRLKHTDRDRTRLKGHHN